MEPLKGHGDKKKKKMKWVEKIYLNAFTSQETLPLLAKKVSLGNWRENAKALTHFFPFHLIFFP